MLAMHGPQVHIGMAGVARQGKASAYTHKFCMHYILGKINRSSVRGFDFKVLMPVLCCVLARPPLQS